jgi:hypothetical protein
VNGFTQARPTWSGAAPPLAGTVEARRRHQAHAAKVQRVARQLRQRPPARRVSLDEGVVSHQVPKPRDRKYSDDKIDISALTEILEIDLDARTCTAAAIRSRRLRALPIAVGSQGGHLASLRTAGCRFMDGMIHAPDHYVLSLGLFVDSAPYVNRYDWMGVYCQSTRTRAEDYLRTPDYFFRTTTA